MCSSVQYLCGPAFVSTHLRGLSRHRARLLEDVHRDLSLELTLAREHYKEQADRLCSDAPRFAVGDFVWLLRRNIATTRPCLKLDYKTVHINQPHGSVMPIKFSPCATNPCVATPNRGHVPTKPCTTTNRAARPSESCITNIRAEPHELRSRALIRVVCHEQRSRAPVRAARHMHSAVHTPKYTRPNIPTFLPKLP